MGRNLLLPFIGRPIGNESVEVDRSFDSPPLQSPSPLGSDFRAGLTKQPLNFFHPMADVVVVVGNRQTYLLPSLLPPSHSLAVFLFDRKKFAPVTVPFLVRSPAKKKGRDGEGERIHNGYEVIGFLF